jgi:hypothetical protein
MTALTPSPRTTSRQLWKPTRLTRWSLWMVPGFAAVFMFTSSIWSTLVFPLLGLKEGDIVLFARSLGGWAAAVIGWALLAAAPAAGLVFAVRALRRGGRIGARVGLVLNSLVALVVAYMVFDEIRMTYFPQFTFPFSS